VDAERQRQLLREAQLDVLKLVVRQSCHRFNNLLTHATLNVADLMEPGACAEVVAVQKLKAAVTSLTREVEALHQTAFGGEGAAQPQPLYHIRDEVVGLLRLARRGAPAVDVHASDAWGEYVCVRSSSVRLILMQIGAAALEVAPKMRVVMIAECAEGGVTIQVDVAAPAAVFAATRGWETAVLVAADEGFDMRLAPADGTARVRLPLPGVS
jgi:hypothetical protein